MSEKLGVGEMIILIAARKRRAAQARFEHRQSDAEPPRKTYLSACEQISAAFQSIGFRYARSLPSLKRKADEFTQTIRFQSSPHNVAAEYVALTAHVAVESRRVKRWERMHPVQNRLPSGLIAGGQIGNLLIPH